MKTLIKHFLFTIVLLIALATTLHAQEISKAIGTSFTMQTTLGDIELILYKDTPLHHDNMIKLIKEGFYDNQIFHRVIENFMIQGGDPHSVNAPKGQRLGTGGPGYTIPAEFRDHYFHKKGALAAARKGDQVNPEKKSSGSQFYIVQGRVFSEEQLAYMDSTEMHEPFTPEQVRIYTTVGGAPHLDGAYTVFGEVISGFDVLDSIASVKTDNYDRPLEDITYTMELK